MRTLSGRRILILEPECNFFFNPLESIFGHDFINYVTISIMSASSRMGSRTMSYETPF